MKKFLAIILSLVLVFSLTACVANLNVESTPPEKSDGEKIQFTVIVVHKDEKEKIFLYDTEPGKLGDILEEEGLIDSQGADEGMFHTVDGEKADWNENQSYWAFFVENEYAMKGIYDTTAENGRTYKLVYTIG